LRFAVTVYSPVIAPGDVAELSAFAEGGTPPYTFSWTPVDGLDDPTRSNPLATPPTTTTYTVVMTDATGATLHGSGTVWVSDLVVYAFASPRVVRPGASSQLSAEVHGGTPPYSFSWTPIDGLDRPTEQNPI